MSSGEEEELMMVEDAEASDDSDDAPIQLALARSSQSAVASSDFMRALPLMFKAACPPAADDASNMENMTSLPTLCFTPSDADVVELDAVTGVPTNAPNPPKVLPGPLV